MSTPAPLPNGHPTSSAAATSQTLTNNDPSSQSTLTASQPPHPQYQPYQPHHPQQNPSSTSAPRPRDARTIELLLTAQGVTSFEQRVPLLLLDFAYRHTSSVLQDALHLSADPYTSQAGSKPTATSGVAPVNVGDAQVSSNAVQLAIAARLGFQFRSGGGQASKDWMLEVARERNKIALPRVPPTEWGTRLPGERFVLSGQGWGLRDVWEGQGGVTSSDEEEEDDEEMIDALGGGDKQVEEEDVGGDGVEGGTMGDVFGDEGMGMDEDEDEEMVEV
ncbi:transcription initiation factor IID, 31kD subunit-domain-containing protein [Podospora fimiseda]|uniref:Transcription initiation factor IID, 31kD subunit-domain-containing protein n=1 Tax=Podospora fimiseda TaxID=252190 RepID=A0AAN7H1F5_9PEZI|nr:transcription initiation factor IID, 31kD subunit-domain-containing protein [Podospora fimiseda]